MEQHRCFVKRIYNETDASSVSENDETRVLMLDIRLPYKSCCDEALSCTHGLSRLCTARFEASLLGIAGLVVAAAAPFI